MRAQMLRFGILMLAVVFAPAALADEFRARLGRTPVDSRNQASVTGLGHASAELNGDRLRIEGEFAGLQGPATVANLHLGSAVGVRGPVIFALELTAGVDGTVRGDIRLNRDQQDALKAGRLYIQISSEAAPEGNLWGWLLAD